jgi:multidrug efflux system outer membrane protein
VLQAEQSLFPAELQLAPLRASAFSSSVNIYKAMGGGWIVEADKMNGDTAPPPAERSMGMPPLFYRSSAGCARWRGLHSRLQRPRRSATAN